MDTWTRRSVLGLLPALSRAASIGKGQELPSDRGKYPDPATEFEVVRLTSAAYSSFLPAPAARIVSRHSDFYLFASNRTGTLEGFRMDIKNGNWRQLTQCESLDPDSLVLLPQDRSIAYFDQERLCVGPMSVGKERVVYESSGDWRHHPGLHVADDGMNAFAVEVKDGQYRLRMISLGKGSAITLAEQPFPIELIGSRPKRASFLYRADNAIWLVHHDGKQNRRLKTAAGKVASAYWSPEGEAVEYLLIPEESNKLNSLREHTPDSSADVLIGSTSQFVTFTANSDATVFLGASRSKASPVVLLLIRYSKRELTLCEHKASDPSNVRVRFTPSSQRILFQSDMHGKSAIYYMDVKKLVELTEES